MRRIVKLIPALVLGIPVIVLIAYCGFISSFILGKCDFDGFLTDKKTKEEFFAALSEFGRQHNLSFDYGWHGVRCTEKGVEYTIDYDTPLSFSKYGISYELLLSVAYSLDSKEITLQIPDQFSETEAVLNYIDSLSAVIVEFENNPQVEEFSKQLQQDGNGIEGEIYRDSLWIKINPNLTLIAANRSMSAKIFYSIPTQSITSYSLPNRMTWREFPEVSIVREIVSKDLLVGELSKCFISNEKTLNGNTSVQFIRDGSIKAGITVICSDTSLSEKRLTLILYPDGSYDLESVK